MDIDDRDTIADASDGNDGSARHSRALTIGLFE
jgi:hypothetical protein